MIKEDTEEQVKDMSKNEKKIDTSAEHVDTISGSATAELAYLLSHLDAIGKKDDFVVISNTCGWGDCIKAGHLRELYRLARLGAAVDAE